MTEKSRDYVVFADKTIVFVDDKENAEKQLKKGADNDFNSTDDAHLFI